MIDVKTLLILVAVLVVAIFFFIQIAKKGNDIERKIFGIIMFGGGAGFAGFGLGEMSNYEYQLSKLLAEYGGWQYLYYSPIGLLVTGGIVAVLGFILLVMKKKKSYY